MTSQPATPSCPEPATPDDLALLDSHFASAKAASQPITLRHGDSVNLTTGVVTRAPQSTKITYDHSVVCECDACRIRSRNLKGLRANYLVALQLVITRDPSIPTADCAWTAEACHRSQIAHGRHDGCLIHPLAAQRLVPCYPGQHHWGAVESGPCVCGQRSI